MKTQSMPLLVLALLAILTPLRMSAVVTAISAVTDDGNYNLTSITTGGQTYSSLLGATADVRVTISTASDAVIALYIFDTPPVTSRAQLNSAASGLDYHDSPANIYNPSTFQFGRTITEDDVIFLFDFGTGDACQFSLIDSGGSTIGDYSISLSAGDFGVTDPITFVDAVGFMGDETTTQIFTHVDTQRGVGFTLSDFTGSIGDISQATGIILTTPFSTLDPSVVGLATVPEFGSSSLVLALFGVMSVVFYRCRIRSRSLSK